MVNKKHAPKAPPLADEFLALLKTVCPTDLDSFNSLTKARFNKIYTALSKVDESKDQVR